jgi:hypothetical protein
MKVPWQEQGKPSAESEISSRPLSSLSRTTVKLRSKVGCQELIRMGSMKERGEIPANYKASDSIITPEIVDLEMPSTDTGSPTSVTGQSILSSTAADAADPSATSKTATYSSPNKPANADYFVWVVNRLSRREKEHIPGYTAVRSVTVKCNFHPTTTVLL